MTLALPSAKFWLSSALALSTISVATRAVAAPYLQTDLVSDLSGLAILTDPDLKNPWGVSESSSSPFWISNQSTGTSTLYDVTNTTSVTKVGLTVDIPTTTGGPQGPTGQVNNTNTTSFLVGNGGNGGAAHFIFANLNGTISAWDTGGAAFIQATTANAVYTGLAINTAQTMIYAANDAGTGRIDVFNSAFAPVSMPGAFVDPNLPAGYVPFNVRDIAGNVYVTYAPGGRTNMINAPAGSGIVDVYNEAGVFQYRLVTGGPLAAPWGLALAPAGFGTFGGDLLVGNFSYTDSEINAFNPTTGMYEGTIPIDVGAGNMPGGLWDLTFGNGGSGGSTDALYFTDGINGEADGLFGVLTPIPEPSSILLLSGAIAWLGLRRTRRGAGRARGVSAADA